MYKNVRKLKFRVCSPHEDCKYSPLYNSSLFFDPLKSHIIQLLAIAQLLLRMFQRNLKYDIFENKNPALI